MLLIELLIALSLTNEIRSLEKISFEVLNVSKYNLYEVGQ
jgi:hypothetical protein